MVDEYAMLTVNKYEERDRERGEPPEEGGGTER